MLVSVRREELAGHLVAVLLKRNIKGYLLTDILFQFDCYFPNKYRQGLTYKEPLSAVFKELIITLMHVKDLPRTKEIQIIDIVTEISNILIAHEKLEAVSQYETMFWSSMREAPYDGSYVLLLLRNKLVIPEFLVVTAHYTKGFWADMCNNDVLDYSEGVEAFRWYTPSTHHYIGD